MYVESQIHLKPFLSPEMADLDNMLVRVNRQMVRKSECVSLVVTTSLTNFAAMARLNMLVGDLPGLALLFLCLMTVLALFIPVLRCRQTYVISHHILTAQHIKALKPHFDSTTYQGIHTLCKQQSFQSWACFKIYPAGDFHLLLLYNSLCQHGTSVLRLVRFPNCCQAFCP